MSYHTISRIGQSVRVPIGPDYTLGDEMGAVSSTFAGFDANDIGAFLFSGSGANKLKYARLLIRLANGGAIQSQEEADIVKVWNTRRKKPYTDKFGTHWTSWSIFKGGLNHLAQHPKGSKVSGGFMKTLTNIGLNIATGGLYSIGKAAVNIAKGGKVLKEAKGALASQGIAGGILTPAVGVDKSLMIQGAVAGGALVAATKAGALTGLTGQAAPTALKTGIQAITAAPPSSGEYPGGPSQPGYDPSQPFGPELPQAGAPVEAGMFGGLSPMLLGLLFGVPLVLQFVMKGSPGSKGRKSP